jgi:hypothetical protein
MDAGGSIFIEGQTSELLKVEPGAWTMVFVLARADRIDEAVKEVRAGSRAAIVLEQKIIVAE